MKITNLSITNFRGIRHIEMQNLGDTIIIAGQNGSGKSCVFDAIRLLKSVYGGYQANEWQQWMGEFQIALSNRSSDFRSMFNDPTHDLRISCQFKLADDERSYILTNAIELLTQLTWQIELPEAYALGSGHRMAMFAAQFRDKQPLVAAKAKELHATLVSELAALEIKAECFIPVGGVPYIHKSAALSVIFSTFRPDVIGVIDYHGAQRHYSRELVQGINLDLSANEQQRSLSALYNSAAKYNNVKGEMAAAFVKEILAEKAGMTPDAQSTLTLTLKELFSTFFPDKEFLGPQATLQGALKFPVKTADGNEHDLDELSAGEKEILYGYLRIRNSAPKNSIIILDEPELHLNPRLIRGLPQFYRKNLGEALGNQIWLVTHSDALLREVVGRESYHVFHMLPAPRVPKGDLQLRPLKATADLDLALVNLVGDLAAYRPSGKVVIFEGGGNSDFDRRVTGALFPELQEKANLISGSNKAMVRALHETLEAATRQGQLPFQFYAVTDKDSDEQDIPTESIGVFSWDVYHIENYFLEVKYIKGVIKALGNINQPSEGQILDQLRLCAHETLPQLIRHELGVLANRALISAINTGTDPAKGDLVGELHAAIMRSTERLKNQVSTTLSIAALRAAEQTLRTDLESNLADGTWVKTFRGRDILKRFSTKWCHSVPYESFRNLILSRMQDDNYQPLGMKAVIEKILK